MEFGLLLGTLAKRGRTKINLLTLLVGPNERMAIFANLKIPKTFGVLQILKNLAARNDRPKVDDANIAIVPLDLQDAMDHDLSRSYSRDIIH